MATVLCVIVMHNFTMPLILLFDKSVTIHILKMANNFSFKYDGEIPDTSTFALRMWNSVKRSFVKNFIDHGRWKTILTGLWVTIKLTVCALLIGIVLGFLVILTISFGLK